MSGQVYLLKAEQRNIYKIGMSDGNIKNRIQSLQTGCPYQIKLVLAVVVENPVNSERYFHYHFRAFKMQGEWYNLGFEQVKELLEMMQKLQLENIVKVCKMSDKISIGEFTETQEVTAKSLKKWIVTESEKSPLEYMRWLPEQNKLIEMLEKTPFKLPSFMYYTLRIRDVNEAMRARQTIGNLLFALERGDLLEKLQVIEIKPDRPKI
jgi:hypothetical protein